MNRVSPPFGMDSEVLQTSAYPHHTTKVFPNPYGRPDCYAESIKPCGTCPWSHECKNAEGRV